MVQWLLSPYLLSFCPYIGKVQITFFQENRKKLKKERKEDKKVIESDWQKKTSCGPFGK